MTTNEIKQKIIDVQKALKVRLLNGEFVTGIIRESVAHIVLCEMDYIIYFYDKPEHLNVYGVVDIDLSAEEAKFVSDMICGMRPEK